MVGYFRLNKAFAILALIPLLNACGSSRLLQGSTASSASVLATASPSVASTVAPVARNGQTVVYDGVSQRLLLFGGVLATDQTELGDTWAHGDMGWSVVGQPPVPAARADAVAVFDSVRKNIVLFGGRTRSQVFSETWVWNGQLWAQQKPTVSPPKSPQPGNFTFDLFRGEAVLFANDGISTSAAGPKTFTWIWTGTDWVQKNPATSPPFRWGSAMAYDRASNGVVLFGGYQTETPVGGLGDTWIWNGATWTQAITAAVPRPGYAYAAYDEKANRLWLLTLDGAMWFWSANNWTRQGIYPAVAHRFGGSMLFDGGRGRIVLYGGAASSPAADSPFWTTTVKNDLWAWDGVSWTQID